MNSWESVKSVQLVVKVYGGKDLKDYLLLTSESLYGCLFFWEKIVKSVCRAKFVENVAKCLLSLKRECLHSFD